MTRCRLIVLIALSLLVGAAVNVGIAWWAALEPSRRHADHEPWRRHARHEPRRVIAGLDGWYVVVRSGIGWTGVEAIATEVDWSDPNWGRTSSLVEGRVPGWSIATSAPRDELAVEETAKGTKSLSWFDLAAGWPLRALVYRERETSLPVATGSQTASSVAHGFFVVNPTTRQERTLPLRPLPLGFMLNTLLYALLVFLLLTGPGAVRARRRIRRGRCPGCGYDLSASPAGPCPECGREAT